MHNEITHISRARDYVLSSSSSSPFHLGIIKRFLHTADAAASKESIQCRLLAIIRLADSFVETHRQPFPRQPFVGVQVLLCVRVLVTLDMYASPSTDRPAMVWMALETPRSTEIWLGASYKAALQFILTNPQE